MLNVDDKYNLTGGSIIIAKKIELNRIKFQTKYAQRLIIHFFFGEGAAERGGSLIPSFNFFISSVAMQRERQGERERERERERESALPALFCRTEVTELVLRSFDAFVKNRGEGRKKDLKKFEQHKMVRIWHLLQFNFFFLKNLKPIHIQLRRNLPSLPSAPVTTPKTILNQTSYSIPQLR